MVKYNPILQDSPILAKIRELLNENSATAFKHVKKPFAWKTLGGVMAGLLLFVVVGGAIFSSSNNDISTPTNSSEQEETGPVAARVEGVSVTLKGVNGLSWVAVSDSSGTTQYSGRIRQGESMTYKDDQLIYLVIGNAGAIQLTVNGEDLGVPGKVGEVLRLECGPQALANQG